MSRASESDDDLDALGDRLERRFRTTVSRVDVAGAPIDLLHPANADDLISEADFVNDDRLPYWADIWPSSHALAARVSGDGGRGRSLLELGCGAGLVSSAAARAGFEVTATDYYADALEFARVNAWRNVGARIAARMVDWRSFPADLGAFDMVVASDVLYERHYAPLLAYALARTIARGGVGVMADPGRVGVEAWLAACAERGLEVRQAERVPYEAGEIRQTITLYEISWPRGRARRPDVQSAPPGGPFPSSGRP